jgi:hypothetical protein
MCGVYNYSLATKSREREIKKKFCKRKLLEKVELTLFNGRNKETEV